MKTFVIDTSALMRLFIPDGELPDGIDKLILEAEKDEAVILAPGLMIIEAGQVIFKKWKEKLLTEDEAESLYADIMTLPIRLCDNTDFAVDAFKLSLLHDITVYDALFLSIARFYSATLITVDRELKNSAQKTGLETS